MWDPVHWQFPEWRTLQDGDCWKKKFLDLLLRVRNFVFGDKFNFFPTQQEPTLLWSLYCAHTRCLTWLNAGGYLNHITPWGDSRLGTVAFILYSFASWNMALVLIRDAREIRFIKTMTVIGTASINSRRTENNRNAAEYKSDGAVNGVS